MMCSLLPFLPHCKGIEKDSGTKGKPLECRWVLLVVYRKQNPFADGKYQKTPNEL